jgi:hypothetical protein
MGTCKLCVGEGCRWGCALVEVGSGLVAGRLAGLQLVQMFFIGDGAKMVRGAAGGRACAGVSVMVVSNGARG